MCSATYFYLLQLIDSGAEAYLCFKLTLITQLQ